MKSYCRCLFPYSPALQPFPCQALAFHGMTQFIVARPRPDKTQFKPPMVSVIIPARNELKHQENLRTRALNGIFHRTVF